MTGAVRSTPWPSTGCETMQIWFAGSSVADMPEGTDALFSGDACSDGYWRKDGVLMLGDTVAGAALTVASGDAQAKGIDTIGLADWLLVDFTDWSMIPLENLIAHADGTPTKIAAIITAPMQAQGAGFALQIGVDALVVGDEPALVEAALSVKAQRTERATSDEQPATMHQHAPVLHLLEVTEIKPVGMGDRYCLDFLNLLDQGEGVLVGSSAQMMALVHSETLQSSFVPTRPFRVNAGSPHAYVLMADGRTKYLSELASGDAVAAVNTEGGLRPVVLGRIKIELRPMLMVSMKHGKNSEGKPYLSHIHLQQAETVRLVGAHRKATSVTDLRPGDRVLGTLSDGARHIGVAVSSSMEER